MPLSYDEYLLISQYGTVDEEEERKMLNSSKQQYVQEHHHNAVFQIESGKLAGYWKSYVGTGKGGRKQIVKKSYDDLVDAICKYYWEGEKKTYEAVFTEWLDYICSKRNLSGKTKTDYLNLFSILGESFGKNDIATVTDDVIEKAISASISANNPTKDRLKRAFSTVKNVLSYAMKKRLVQANNADYVDLESFYKDCRAISKSDNEKEFTPGELDAICADCIKELKYHTPSPLMTLLARYTGMRAGELPVLRWSDIVTDRDGVRYIHIHRQQSKVNGSTFEELPFTKDERSNPHGGRYFPVTDQIQQVLDLIQERIPMCEKGYLFHLNGVPISKDSYEQNLSRRCKRLGIPKGNNHAFRMALNSELIDLGFSTAERAVLLGHTVRTNEQVYSLAGTHRVRGIGKRLKEKNTYSIYSISA